ncbi:uncharacterized protein LOC130815843 isoform X1 [Amaranthus tricolor]|uniref:uncharacterized protein LOC130815843 isoform X1 n=1 Tax=Amaranthus tricolor TaxID=29722 RepID=UPI002583F76D|nr:uncharacterized protein LOC130815843 isoform X1 [Amaranthus tricolor]
MCCDCEDIVFESLHWILLVICPLTNNVHVFDSLQKPQSPPRNTKFKALLNAKMKKVRGQMGSTSRATFPKWTAIKCFQQPSTSVDCGYYTLKYMDDIIKSVKDFGVENIDAVLNDIPRETRPLRSGEMRELKDKIAAYLANFCP